jgi:DNA polymerase III subunit delta'
MSAAPKRKPAAAPKGRVLSYEVEVPVPESDRLDPFPHPRFTPDLYGHAQAEATLRNGFRQNQLHHAWLIAGPEGIGKATLAWRFVRYALAAEAARDPETLDVDFEHPTVRRVLTLGNPNLYLLRRAWNEKTKKHGQTIAVEEVRELKEFLGRTAEEGQWRAVVIDRAEDLYPAAANALLKTLEEPPKRTLFLMVTGEPGRLLPTIRSRCRRLDLSPLPPDQLALAVAGPLAAAGMEGHAPEDTGLYAGLAAGSTGRALTLSAGGGLDLYRRLTAVLSRAPKLDLEGAYRLADELAPAAAEAKFDLAMALLRDLIGRLVRHAARGPHGPGGALPGEAELFRRLAGDGGVATAARWSELWSRLEAARTEAQTLNLDRRSLVVLHLSALADASR